jgi:arylsulfatase A-like enzyme
MIPSILFILSASRPEQPRCGEPSNRIAKCEMTVKHRLFLVAVALAFSTRLLSFAAGDKPNVVFILADDLGIGNVQCYGGDRCQIDTPHFDRLAREGMRFTNAHSIGSVCVPSRVGIMTGRYAWRFGSSGPGGPWGFLGTRLPVGQHTVATMLKSAGYRTGYVGKWHLGTLMQTNDGKDQGPSNVDYSKPLKIGPPQYGFDDSFILPGSLDMYPYAYVRNNRWVGDVTAQKGWRAFNRIGPAAEDYEVLDTFCDEAERFIAQSVDASDGGQPFFLYLALTSPHTPLSPSAEFEGKSRIGIYGDFVMETDDCVGRILAALEENGVDKNTLVIATSDHGAAPYAGRNRKATDGQLKELEKEGHFASGIFRGYKFSAYEGGFCVPFVARCPAAIPAGATCDRLVGLHDLMATPADISGCELTDDQAPDSISILPLLRDAKATSPRRSMIFQATRGMAIRSDDWKLLFCPGAGCDDRWLIPDGHETAWKNALAAHGKRLRSRQELLQPAFVQLFNLANDPSETTDLASQQVDQVRELHDLYDQQVNTGRSTPGPPLTNDRGTIRAFPAVSKFVWAK